MQRIHLDIDRDLINPKFEGYKVSIDNIHVDSKSLEQDLCSRSPSKSMVTFQHVKLFANSNSLFFNSVKPTDPGQDHLYRIINTGHIQMIIFNKLTNSWDTSIVGRIEVGETDRPAFPVNLLFTEKDITVACDGISKITVFLLASETNWVKMLEYEVQGAAGGLSLIEARILNNKLEVLTQTIENEGSKTFSKIQWITVGLDDIDFAEELTVEKRVDFVQKGHFETCTFGENGNIIFLSSEKPKLESDDICNGYKWTQEESVIKVTFELKTAISEEDIDLKITKSEIALDVKGTTLLIGNLHGEVDADDVEIRADSEAKTLELILKPLEKTEWKELITVRNPRRGAMLGEQQQASETFGAEQTVEECDEAESSLFLNWVDPTTGQVVKQCDVSGCQVLFTRRNCVTSATVCLRHDVDGILLSLDDSSPRHLATLQAFGYVQASKLNRFWSGTSPSNKFACIVENSNRILLYSQKVGIEGTLSNRKTSSTVGHVAKQYLFRIECSDGVQGVHLTDEHLFAVTKNQIHVAKLPC